MARVGVGNGGVGGMFLACIQARLGMLFIMQVLVLLILLLVCMHAWSKIWG